MAKGVEVKDLGWNAFFQRVYEIENRRVKVGILAENGGDQPQAGTDLTLAEIGLVNEFGSEDGHVPSRSFLRSTFDEERDNLNRNGDKLIGAVLDGKMDVDKALGIQGAYLATAVKKKITDTKIPPPNAPATVRGKGSSHPLVNTGALVGSITWSTAEGEDDSE